jgi:hypothetical protein
MLPILAAFNARIPLLYEDLAERFAGDIQEMSEDTSAARLF